MDRGDTALKFSDLGPGYLFCETSSLSSQLGKHGVTLPPLHGHGQMTGRTGRGHQSQRSQVWLQLSAGTGFVLFRNLMTRRINTEMKGETQPAGLWPPDRPGWLPQARAGPTAAPHPPGLQRVLRPPLALDCVGQGYRVLIGVSVSRQSGARWERRGLAARLSPP